MMGGVKEGCFLKAKIVDERIQKESDALLAVMFWVMAALQAVVLGVKLALGAEVLQWALDGLILLGGLGVMVVLRSQRGLWCRRDEALRELDNRVLALSYGMMLWVTLIGSVVLVFGDSERSGWYAPSLLPLLITSLVYLVLAVRRGLLLWGSRQAKGNAKARLRRSTALGALLYGALMGAPACFEGGSFRPMGLVKILLMAAVWGLLFYGAMVWLIDRGEKAADKAVKEASIDAEE